MDDKSNQANIVAAALSKGRKDPVYFGEYLLGLRFHDKQKVWLWLTTKTRIREAYSLGMQIGLTLPELSELEKHKFLKNILAPGNRFGKTLVTAVKHIWYNFYKRGAIGSPEHIADVRYETLNLSPHSMQVEAAYRYILDIFSDKFIYTWNGQTIRNHCLIKEFLVDHKQVKREIIFSNNSSVKGVSTGEDQASSLAGTQFYYISYDEAPQSLHLQDELPAKIQSRLLDSGGPLDIVGTPEADKASHVYYSRIVKDGLTLKNGFFTMTGGIKDNKFISDEKKTDILETIRQTDPNKYLQVAFGNFISVGKRLFVNQVIERLWEDYNPIEAGIPGRKYLISIDWGFADNGDPTVIDILDVTDLYNARDYKEPLDGVHYRIAYHNSVVGSSPNSILALVAYLQNSFNDAPLIHDSSSMGGIVISKLLHELGVRHIYDMALIRVLKEEMLLYLLLVLNDRREISTNPDGTVKDLNPQFGKLRSFVIPSLEEQLGNYTIDDTKLEQDEVMALAMGIWYGEKKIMKHKVKSFNLNVFASDPKDILKLSKPKKKISKNPIIRTRELSVTERRL